jgi:teichuronic acid biosynthesis glycosyltransferase TuaG
MIEPEISVIIPAYNCGKYIDKAIESIFDQDVPVEVIVVDDNSNDNTEEILNKYVMKKDFIYIKNNKNIGVAKARNIGVKAAKSNYIAFLDADDWWKPNKLITQMELMKSKNGVLCYTARELVNEEGISTNRVIHVKKTVNYQELLLHNCISCSSVLVKREALLKHPMQFSNFHEDYITWLKILKEYGTALGIDEPLLTYRLSKGGKSRNKIKSARMTFGVYRVMGFGKIKSFYFTCSHLAHGIIKYY